MRHIVSVKPGTRRIRALLDSLAQAHDGADILPRLKRVGFLAKGIVNKIGVEACDD